MADFVSMKSDKAEDKLQSAGPTIEPYPLQLYLDKPQVDALKLGEYQNVGATCTLTVQARVVGVNASQNEGGDDYSSMRLAITAIRVDSASDSEKEPKSDSEIASKLYSAGE